MTKKALPANAQGLSNAEKIISTWPAHLQIPQYLPDGGLPPPGREISDKEADMLFDLVNPYKNW
jgi:hypothetical protein